MASWPIFGRTNELSQLTAALAEKRGAVITGPSGVGKTALARTCLEQAEGQGMKVARTTATHASQVLPFGALASILPADTGGDDLAREQQGQLLHRYTRALIEGAEGRPLLVFVDDAHLLDDGSATLIQQLALTGSGTVMATVRSGEPTPYPVVALWKDGPAERIEVDVLTNATIGELLEAVLGGPVDAGSVRQLFDRSRGNPLFLRELVTGALEAGTLVEDDGIWRLRGTLSPTSRLVELVALRLGNLTEPERDVLALLTLGEPLGQATLTRLTDPDSVKTLESKGLISSRIDGRRLRVWLAHPLYGDVTRVGITALHQRALARSRADVVEATGGRRREDTLMLASWHLLGGGKGPGILVAGAIAARARHDHALAERLARAAIEEGAGFEARFVAAEAAHFQGRPDQAEQELAALAAQATTDAERTRVALVRFDNAWFLQGGADNIRLLDEAADMVSDSLRRDELLSRRFFIMFSSHGPRATVEAASPLLDRPRSERLIAGYSGVGHGLNRLGRLQEALEPMKPLSDDAAIPAADDPWDHWSLFHGRVEALIYAGRLAEAEELLMTAYGQVIHHPLIEAWADVSGQLAIVHLDQGRIRSAFRRASEARALFQQLERPILSRWPYFTAARLWPWPDRLTGPPRPLPQSTPWGWPCIRGTRPTSSRPGPGRR